MKDGKIMFFESFPFLKIVREQPGMK